MFLWQVRSILYPLDLHSSKSSAVDPRGELTIVA